MSIPFTGVLARSGGLLGAIGKQVKLLNLQPTKKITVQFDPFYEKVKHIRDFLFQISTPKVLRTNLTCVLKTNIVCDRSEPTVTCELVNGEKVLFKCANLNTLDLLTLYNKHITPLAPPEEIETKGIIIKKKAKKTKKRRPLNRR